MHHPIDLSVAVGRARDGDSIATEALARRACALALRTAAVITSNYEEAADISQDVALDVLNSLDRLREPEAFDGWVHRITVRRALKILRRRNAARKAEVPLGLIAEPDEPMVVEDIDRTTLLAVRSALAKALPKLPAKQRLAIALRYVHDLSDAEIAAALDCRLGTAQVLLSRARSALRSHPQLAALTPTLGEGESA